MPQNIQLIKLHRSNRGGCLLEKLLMIRWYPESWRVYFSHPSFTALLDKSKADLNRKIYFWYPIHTYCTHTHTHTHARTWKEKIGCRGNQQFIWGTRLLYTVYLEINWWDFKFIVDVLYIIIITMLLKEMNRKKSSKAGYNIKCGSGSKM